MNPELRQRLIGAIVVTALAAIFVPMMFDDPVEEPVRSVSELSIPQEPTLPSAEVVPPAPVAASEVPVDVTTEPESSTDNLSGSTGQEAGVLSKDELEAEAPSDEEQELAMESPVDDAGNADTPNVNKSKKIQTLDTGLVDEEPQTLAPSSVKQLTPKPATKPTVVKTETLPAVKPVINPVKPLPATKPVEVKSVEHLDKSVKSVTEPSRWFIQAGSFSKKENAMTLADNLRKQGMPVLLETIQVSGKGTFYRLKVGPELDKKRAAAMKSKLDQQNISTMIVGE